MNQETIIESNTETSTETVGDYIKDTDGKWILSPESKTRNRAMYYSGRLAYNPNDSRFPIGRYNSVGEIIPFNIFPKNPVDEA